LVTDEQLEEIVLWLRHDYWCVRHRLHFCLWCGTREHASYAAGLCGPCYFQYRRLCLRLGLPTTLEAQRELVTERTVAAVVQNLISGRALSMGQLGQLAREVNGE
jgi:hypothetical protein